MTQSKSIRSQLASLCQDLIQDKDQKDNDTTSSNDDIHHSKNHQDHSPNEPNTSLQQKQQQQQPQHNHQNGISIENALNRNPYAIFLHDPTIVATNLNTSVEKVKQTRRQAANFIMKNEIIGTNSYDLISNYTNMDSYTFSNSNMLLDYYNNQHKNTCHPDTIQWIHASSSSRYFSTGSTHFDEWCKQMTSINGSNIHSKQSRKRLRTQDPSQTEMNSNTDNDCSAIGGCEGGGIPLGQVTQIVGPSASGKTQLGLTVSAQAILFHPDLCKVYYIVGGGGNSSLVALSRRFKSIASKLLQTHCQKQQGQESQEQYGKYDHVMHKFEISSTQNAYMLLSRLNEIESNLDAQVQVAKEKLNSDIEMGEYDTETNRHSSYLIVIDSISGCISSLVWGDGDGGAGASLMNEIALSLRRLSRMERFPGCPRVAVLVINGAVTNRSTNGIKSALGEAWRAADSTILLEPLLSGTDIDFKSHPIGRPFVKDKVVRVKYDEMDDNDKTVEFRISSHGITNL